MKIGIVGTGHIGSNVARQAVRVGHEVAVSFTRDEARLKAVADQLGATFASPADAVAASEIVVISVPWPAVPEALAQTGDLAGKIVVDTTNQFGGGPHAAPGETAAAFNQRRMPGARYTKSFNTLTAGFQEKTAGRSGPDRVVQWVCGDDAPAKAIVCDLIDQMGYAAIDLGGTADCAVMESPRRAGAVYGEEYHPADAQLVVEALRAGRPIPPTPTPS